MKTFKPINREYVAPIDLTTLSNTYKELEQGHQKAVQFDSELRAKMAELDLNEAEDEWRQNKVNSIKSTLSDNTQYGNAAGAVDDLVKTAGDIFSDPAMIGRLRAQKDYKTYIENLDKDNTLPELYKDYYRTVNNYEYKDIKNKNGDIIGGTKWSPKERQSDFKDINEAYKLALQYAAKESGGSASTKFMDINGNITDKYNPNSYAVVYNTSTQKYERLSEDKIRSALQAVLAANPEYNASLQQDYKIANWAHDNNKGELGVMNPNGTKMTYDQFIESKFTPFIKSATYNNKFTDVKYNENVGKDLASLKEAVMVVNTNNNYGELKAAQGHNVIYKDNTGVKATAAVNNANGTLQSSINSILGGNMQDFGIDPTKIDIRNKDGIKEYLINKGISEQYANNIYRMATDIYNRNEEDIKYLSELKLKGTPKAKGAMDAYNLILSGSDYNIDSISDPETKRYLKDYANIIESYYPDGSTRLTQKFTDDSVYQYAVDQFGGINGANQLGIILGTDESGSKTITLPKSRIDSFNRFSTTIINAYNSKSYLDKVGNAVKQMFGYGDETLAVDDNGNKIKTIGSTAYSKAKNASRTDIGKMFSYTENIGGKNLLSTGLELEPHEIFAPVPKFFKRLDDDSSSITGGSEKVIQTSVVAGNSPEDAILLSQLKNATDKKQIDYINAKRKVIAEENEILFNNGSFINSGVKMFDESSNTYRTASSSEKAKLQDIIQNRKDFKGVDFALVRDPSTGKYVPQATIYQEKKDAPIRILAEGLVNSQTLASWNNNPRVLATTSIDETIVTQKPIKFRQRADVNQSMFLRYVGDVNGQATFNIEYSDNTSAGTVNYETAINLKSAYNTLLELADKYTINPSSVTKDELNEVINNYITANFGTNPSESQINSAQQDVIQMLGLTQ